jgi:hypothetical protein
LKKQAACRRNIEMNIALTMGRPASTVLVGSAPWQSRLQGIRRSLRRVLAVS